MPAEAWEDNSLTNWDCWGEQWLLNVTFICHLISQTPRLHVAANVLQLPFVEFIKQRAPSGFPAAVKHCWRWCMSKTNRAAVIRWLTTGNLMHSCLFLLFVFFGDQGFSCHIKDKMWWGKKKSVTNLSQPTICCFYLLRISVNMLSADYGWFLGQNKCIKGPSV